MKKVIITLILLASIYSCTKETNDMSADLKLTGKWGLVKMTGNVEGSEYTGSEMEWQETYVINKNNSFTKTRIRGDSTVIVSGIYNLIEEGLLDESESDIITYIEFLHNTVNAIIGNCNSNSLTEILYLNSKNELISSWEACDGPGLKYIKK